MGMPDPHSGPAPLTPCDDTFVVAHNRAPPLCIIQRKYYKQFG